MLMKEGPEEQALDEVGAICILGTLVQGVMAAFPV